ncbi:MAG: hypothetical protein ACRD0G_06745, partial [Acidimicrobiales bacterium]
MATLSGGVAPAQQVAPGEFIPGTGLASGQVLAVVPAAGDANLPIDAGFTAARFRNDTGDGDAGTLRLGLIGSLLTTSTCGREPSIRPGSLPDASVLHLNSSDGDQSATTEYPPTGSGAGTQSGTVRSGSYSEFEARPGVFDVPNVIRIGGGVSHSVAELVPDQQRRAVASTEIGSLSVLGGVVELRGLRWHASHVSFAEGTTPEVAGAFTMDEIVVPPLPPMPVSSPDALQSAIDLVNAVLGRLFVTMVLPEVTTAPNGAMVVSPLRVIVSGGDASAALIRPLLGDPAADRARRELANLLFLQGCEGPLAETDYPRIAGGVNTVSDVVIAGLLGSGGVTLEIGGASAGTEARRFDNPFGSGDPLLVPPVVASAGVNPPPAAST